MGVGEERKRGQDRNREAGLLQGKRTVREREMQKINKYIKAMTK